jgi:hypothetical protein
VCVALSFEAIKKDVKFGGGGLRSAFPFIIYASVSIFHSESLIISLQNSYFALISTRLIDFLTELNSVFLKKYVVI